MKRRRGRCRDPAHGRTDWPSCSKSAMHGKPSKVSWPCLFFVLVDFVCGARSLICEGALVPGILSRVWTKKLFTLSGYESSTWTFFGLTGSQSPSSRVTIYLQVRGSRNPPQKSTARSGLLNLQPQSYLLATSNLHLTVASNLPDKKNKILTTNQASVKGGGIWARDLRFGDERDRIADLRTLPTSTGCAFSFSSSDPREALNHTPKAVCAYDNT